VKHWFTINEPHKIAVYGYGYGIHAPDRCSNRSICAFGNSSTEPYLVAHNLLLAHSTAVQIYRQKYQTSQNGSIGIVLDSTWMEPFSTSDSTAANRAMEFETAWFADPVFKGDYPDSMKQYVGDRLPIFSPAEQQLLKGSADFYALNHYTSRYAQDDPNPQGEGPDADQHVLLSPARNGQFIGPPADSSWLYVYPPGIKNTLFWLYERFLDHWKWSRCAKRRCYAF